MRAKIGGQANATQCFHMDFGNHDTGFIVEHLVLKAVQEDIDKKTNKYGCTRLLNQIGSPGAAKFDLLDRKKKQAARRLAKQVINGFSKTALPSATGKCRNRCKTVKVKNNL